MFGPVGALLGGVFCLLFVFAASVEYVLWLAADSICIVGDGVVCGVCCLGWLPIFAAASLAGEERLPIFAAALVAGEERLPIFAAASLAGEERRAPIAPSPLRVSQARGCRMERPSAFQAKH